MSTPILGFWSLEKIIREKLDPLSNQSNVLTHPRSNISPGISPISSPTGQRAGPSAKPKLSLEDALFNHFAQVTQNNKDALRTEDLRQQLEKKYLKDIDKNPNKKVQDEQKISLKKALDRFDVLFSLRKTLFGMLQLTFPADKLSSLRREYIQKLKMKALERYEEREKELDEMEEKEAKFLEEMDEEQHKKMDEFDKELTEDRLKAERERNNKDRLEPEALALSPKATLDPVKQMSDTLTQNLSDLHNVLKKSMELIGVNIQPSNEQDKLAFNKNVYDLEQSMRQGTLNQQEVDSKFQQVLQSINQQYQNAQANIKPENTKAQQILNQWGNHVEQNLMQWLNNGNVQAYSPSFKDDLSKNWGANPPAPGVQTPAAAVNNQQRGFTFQNPAATMPTPETPRVDEAGKPIKSPYRMPDPRDPLTPFK